MKLYGTVILCLPFLAMCASEVSQHVADTMSNRAQAPYKRVMEHGKTCVGKVCNLFEKGKNMLYTRIKNAMSSIRSKSEKAKEVAGSENMQGSEEEAFDLSPEDIEKLIEEVKKKLAGYMDVAEEKNEEEEKKEL
ncbi:hypothetical protein EROM_010220 [Encephalitozoon romaleae SJ-2008]|uniref:Uncharacterized protein n=1 Tax=Encephalitozoon romaleae (strain SJ-2008) TaxID=1178016 RepID=I7APX8_ENCRO|nr:hypothetical protein EROM_010220 [Encephalitozoon romaleae SJ-2008]AFN82367.1 hypothetical protein EROM_010220 [Encephalitozoon romaleae SJ-2008]